MNKSITDSLIEDLKAQTKDLRAEESRLGIKISKAPTRLQQLLQDSKRYYAGRHLTEDINSPRGETDSSLNKDGYEPSYEPEDKSVQEKWFQAIAEGKEPFLKHLLESLDGNEVWLDVGTGLGSAITHFVIGQEKMGKLYGIDLDKRNLDTRKPEHDYLGTELVLADAAEIPLKSNSIDIATSMFMNADNPINETIKWEDIIGEIDRVLKVGGLLITNEEINFTDPDAKPFVDPTKYKLVGAVNTSRTMRIYQKIEPQQAK